MSIHIAMGCSNAYGTKYIHIRTYKTEQLHQLYTFVPQITVTISIFGHV